MIPKQKTLILWILRSIFLTTIAKKKKKFSKIKDDVPWRVLLNNDIIFIKGTIYK